MSRSEYQLLIDKVGDRKIQNKRQKFDDTLLCCQMMYSATEYHLERMQHLLHPENVHAQDAHRFPFVP